MKRTKKDKQGEAKKLGVQKVKLVRLEDNDLRSSAGGAEGVKHVIIC